MGHGSKALLQGTSSTLSGGHSNFEQDLLPEDRTIELSDPLSNPAEDVPVAMEEGEPNFARPWHATSFLPHTLDIFGDASVLIVNAPGHLPGHINLLIQLSPTHQVYLAGDACHDRRLLTGDKAIGEWQDAEGKTCCIHADKATALETIERIARLEREGVEVVFAHDGEWEGVNQGRFFGA